MILYFAFTLLKHNITLVYKTTRNVASHICGAFLCQCKNTSHRTVSQCNGVCQVFMITSLVLSVTWGTSFTSSLARNWKSANSWTNEERNKNKVNNGVTFGPRPHNAGEIWTKRWCFPSTLRQRTITCHFGFTFSGKSRDCDVIAFDKLRFSNLFRPH